MAGKVLALCGLMLMVCLTTVDAQAFSVASTQTYSGTQARQIPFDKIISNGGGAFDPADSTFTCEDPGTYYFSISAGLEAGMGTHYVMERSGIGGIEARNSDTLANGQGFASRGMFSNVQDGVTFQMVANLDELNSVQGDPFTYQTGWNAFKYDNLGDTTLAFSVANSVNTSQSANPMLYDTEILNIGMSGVVFNMTTGIFNCQFPGIYLFHLSAGARGEREVRLNLTRNFPDELIGSLTRTTRTSNGVDTISRTLLVSLSFNDEVHMVNAFGSELYSTGGFQTSFSGFLYTRQAQADGQAFMAFRTDLWDSPLPESPLFYDRVTVNKGQGYNESNSVFTCFLPGSYFVSLSAGSVAGKPVGLSLRHNAQVVMMLQSSSTITNGLDTMSRDVIVEMANGDTLHVQADGGTALFGDIGMQTSFMAFRIKAGA